MYMVAMVLALITPRYLPVPAELVAEAVHATIVHRLEYECLDYSYLKVERLYDTKNAEPKLKRVRVYRMWYEDGASRQLLLAEDNKPVSDSKVESPGPDAFEGLPNRYIYEWAPEYLVVDEDGVLCYSLRFRVRPDYEPDGWMEEALGRMVGTMLIDYEHGYIRHIDGALSDAYSKFAGLAKAQKVTFRFWQRWIPGIDIPVFTRTEAALDYKTFWFRSTKELRTYEYRDHTFGTQTVPPPQ